MAFNTADGKQAFTATAAQTAFNFNFKIYADTDLNVYQNEALLTLTTDYTVTIDGDNGGTMTLVSGATLNDAILLVRDLPATRTTDYQSGGDFLSETIDYDQNYQTYLIADKELAGNQHLRLSEATQGIDTELPAPIALQAIRTNADANGFEFIAIGESDTYLNIANIDTIAELPIAPAIETYNVRGYYARNDGGGGVFNYDATANRATANGGTIIDATGTGTGLGCWIRQYSGVAKAIWFEDVKTAIESMPKLDFGNYEYALSSTITLTPTEDIYWKSDGAKILYNGTSGVDILITINLNGVNFSIDDALELDGNNKAHKGYYILSDSSQDADVLLNNMKIRNFKKTNVSIDCIGIYLRGQFKNITMNNPIILDMLMGTSTGDAGISGVSGITINKTSNAESPTHVEITNPYIENVFAEDETYTSDQDGIRIFGPEDEVGVFSPNELSPHIIGGKFKNCMGRSIKLQTEYATVMGPTFVRDRALQVSPWGVEIDFQTGGGLASDITVRYTNGSVPREVILFNTPELTGKETPNGSLSGSKIFTDAVSPNHLESVVRMGSRNFENDNNVQVSGVNVVGEVGQVLNINTVNGSVAQVMLSDIVASPSVALVQGASTSSGTVSFTNCVNKNLTAKPLFWNTTSTCRYTISSINDVNFDTTYRIAAANTQGSVVRLDSIAPKIDNPNDLTEIKTGLIRPVAFTLDNDATYLFPKTAYNGNTGSLWIVCASSRNDSGLFAYDSAVVNTLAKGGNFEVGGTTEPATGLYRLWTSTDNLKLTNRSGGAKTFTCIMMG